MAIASLALFLLAETVVLLLLFLGGELVWKLVPILHMGQINIERFLITMAFGASISGLILGIRSIRSDKRRRIGIVGTVLNSVAVGGASFLLVLVYTFNMWLN